MKNISFFPSALLLSLLLSSCGGPRILTNVLKKYPDTLPVDSVRVFEIGDPVPNSAEALGRVAVIDAGMTVTSRCHYDEVLRIAREETGKVGGNGLALTDHLKPSFWGSSCHQISGMMLRLTDFEIDTLRSNPIQEAIEMGYEMQKKEEKDRMAPANTFEASIGYGWITSDIYSSTGEKYGSKGGMEWNLEYNHVFRSGFGFGLQYSGCKVSVPEGDMSLSYVAPSVVLRRKIDSWIFKCGVGVGAFFYSQSGYNATSVGVSTTLGMEYMVAKSVGLGLSVNAIGASLPDQEGLPEDQNSGIGRLNVTGGIRFYF